MRALTQWKEHQQNEKVYQAVQRVCTDGRGPRESRSLFGKDSRPQEFDLVCESISDGVFSGCERERRIAGRTEDRRPGDGWRRFDYESGKLKETADLLTVSRVAIYPVGAARVWRPGIRLRSRMGPVRAAKAGDRLEQSGAYRQQLRDDARAGLGDWRREDSRHQ